MKRLKRDSFFPLTSPKEAGRKHSFCSSAITLLHSLTSSPWCDVMACDVIDLDID